VNTSFDGAVAVVVKLASKRNFLPFLVL